MQNEIIKTAMVNVTNRNNGITSYVLDGGIHRTFQIRETKRIDLNELKALKATMGGETLLRQYLLINDKEALEYLNIETEPEYFYTEDEITKLLLEGDVDQLEDCLNFAPEGVIELIKSLGVKLQVPDTRKRKLILEKTGFSIDNAIKVNEIMNADAEPVEEKAAPQRKAAPITTKAETKPERKYNISTKKD